MRVKYKFGCYTKNEYNSWTEKERLNKFLCYKVTLKGPNLPIAQSKQQKYLKDPSYKNLPIDSVGRLSETLFAFLKRERSTHVTFFSSNPGPKCAMLKNKVTSYSPIL